MSQFILRNTTPAENRTLPSSYHTYVAIEVDGDNRQQVATIKKAYRTKNAGGSAWQATVLANREREVVVYSPDLKKLCEIVRYVVTREGNPPSHWR